MANCSPFESRKWYHKGILLKRSIPSVQNASLMRAYPSPFAPQNAIFPIDHSFKTSLSSAPLNQVLICRFHCFALLCFALPLHLVLELYTDISSPSNLKQVGTVRLISQRSAQRNAISPRPLCRLCMKAWQPQKRRKICCAEIRQPLVTPRYLIKAMLFLMLTHRVYYHSPKYCRGDLPAVLGVLFAAHHAVVAAGEHAADCAEDYDGEDGNDDAGGLALSFCTNSLLLLLMIIARTMSMR